MKYESVVNNVLIAGSSRDVGGYDDYVDLCGLASIVQIETKLLGEERLRASLEVIRELLTSGLMVVGDLFESGFVPWNLAIPEALDRVEREWRALGREPNLWEICWFANTPLGNEKVRQGHVG
jgi:hypothetical protein